VAVTGRLDLLAVNVGKVETIGMRAADRPIRSAIRKHRVSTPTVEVTELGIVGDTQRDRRVHGGPLMAVYAYPADHFADWVEELGHEVAPSTFGENLTVAGLVEDQVRVGDRFAWGDVGLRVTQPRFPCFKLDIHLGRKVGLFMLAHRSTGWYCAVDRPGTAPTSGVIERIAEGDGPTIHSLVAARDRS
jgi:MOSC domain-containing protein YiiM